MENIVNKNVRKIDIDKIETITGLAYTITKIIEKVHSKKNLSYQDSQKLIDLVITAIINIHQPAILINNKQTILFLVNELIKVWDIMAKIKCSCCSKKQNRMKKSVSEKITYV